jgi:phage terminase small subunit
LKLGPVARREWDQLAGDLVALRMPTNLDRAALAAYCGVHALWAEAAEDGTSSTRSVMSIVRAWGN